jgi:hypothetical protein
MMRSGTISVFMGMLPEMNTTEPYSPIARANASANPVSSAGPTLGRITRVKICHRRAPRLAAASSTSTSRSSSTGCTVRTTKGRPMKSRAIVIPSQVYDTLMPSGSSQLPIHPLGVYSVVSAMPATAVGRAKGRSTIASTSRRPGNR